MQAKAKWNFTIYNDIFKYCYFYYQDTHTGMYHTQVKPKGTPT